MVLFEIVIYLLIYMQWF